MSLISNQFAIFVLVAVAAYYLVPKKCQWVVLLLFSYAYYLYGSARFLFFLVFSTAVTYLCALQIDRMWQAGKAQKAVKPFVAIGLIANLGMLGAVKGFSLLLPLGISFYTFQSSGYLLDVYWKRVRAQKNPFRYALFVSFFPQILQGPIGNYGRLSKQLFAEHAFSWDAISYGTQRIIWGLCKKMILADWAGVFADAIWGDLDRYNGITLFALLFYGIQLYGDFSGGMDVVIGIGNLFGITMDENFRMPYLAKSMAEFWERWHITLGEWMKNYVFYPVSLSRWMMRFSK